MLHLGAILATVPNWKKIHKLRTVLFVEYEEDNINDKERINPLVRILRINVVVVIAVVVVVAVCLKTFRTYNTIISGSKEGLHQVDKVLINNEFFE
ncbi:hypothetical protein WICMUC_001016 [Wickerhamomyces mucosus]|uniref:Uncharacterized protein n=1 Tax=Wickerhamomyces mucosus TaxID=1378264 RepID=A0A9P8THV7_9ASCO|nr:hypothetical protein WICMUC_001016 [Wickerhamomyces mucosus]